MRKRNNIHFLTHEVPDSFAGAHKELRDRLFPKVEAAAPEAFALRKAKRFRPAPDVNLVGIGIGEKVSEGRRTGAWCVKVLVAKKYPKGKVGRGDLIPKTLDGIPTDVEGIGYPRAFVPSNRGRFRPVMGGTSVGLDVAAVGFKFAGTLGCVLRRKSGSAGWFGLSNNHVFANENEATLGSNAVQPGTLDGGGNGDRIGTLARFAALKFDNVPNQMDAAIVQLAATPELPILDIGTPSGDGRPRLHQLVRKSGRTTGLTEGVIRIVNFDVVNIQYDAGMVRVDNVIVVEGIDGSFSAPGDSGSAILDQDGKVVALLFAGSTAVTFAIPIRRILRRFKMRIAT